MAFHNPKGRANYEPNSWGGEEGGPREDPKRGFASFPAEEAGAKERVRSETFADHYSQARQFYISQTETEQGHIADALVFELSKVETEAIRLRMISHLLNIDTDLAKSVADGLGVKKMPKAAAPAREPITDLPPSPALSIIRNGPDSFAGRTVGALVADGTDIGLLNGLKTALEKEGASLKIVAPTIGGIEASDGSHVNADEKVNGGPSVVFDAVAVLLTEEAAGTLSREATAKDFLSDAFAHLKFIAYTKGASALFDAAGVDMAADDGVMELKKPADAKGFVKACRKLRLWAREDAEWQV